MSAYITASEAAEIAERSPQTIARWCKKGHLQYKVNEADNSYTILESSLLAFLGGTKKPPKGWILITVAIKRYGIADSTIRKNCKNGNLNSKKLKNRVYVNEAEIKDFATDYDAETSRHGKPDLEYPPATEKQIAQDHLLAYIGNITWPCKTWVTG